MIGRKLPMFFIQLKNGEWWEYDTKRSRLYNIRGGFTSADNIDLSKAIQLESWHALYVETGFNPLKSDGLWCCGWIAPNGDFYQCEAHEADAECIYTLIYGDEHAYYSDRMIELGWKKVAASVMFEYYRAEGQYDTFQSREQEDTFIEWCKPRKQFYAIVSDAAEVTFDSQYEIIEYHRLNDGDFFCVLEEIIK